MSAKKPRQMSPITSGKVEPVFLSGLKDEVNNGISFEREFTKAVPHIKIKQVHFTRLGCAVLTPAAPEDFSRLMKEDWKSHLSLGSNLEASLDKSKTVEYKAVVTGVDPSLDDDVLKEEMEKRNNLTLTSIARFLHKATKAKTWKVIICLENEETQKRVLKEGIFLGFTHHKCEEARAKQRHDRADNPTSQCYRCQKWNPDHTSKDCKAKQACLWCGSEHFHKECPHFQNRDMNNAKCANCNEAHPAWSKSCSAYIVASQSQPRISAANIVSSNSVSRSDLDQEMKKDKRQLWESMALVISTIVSRSLLDLNEELKKPKVDRGALTMQVTTNAVKAIKECGLLDSSSSIEVAGVQQNVWKNVFPQTPFPHPSQADSTPQMASQSK